MSKKPTNRKPCFRFIKKILALFVKRPEFICLGEPLSDQGLYLCNHVGAKGPLNLELYFPKLFRFWGTYEMNDSIKLRFKYLATTYFHQKKHKSKAAAFILAIIAVLPMTGFYKGMQLISTYPDKRLLKTFKTSYAEIEKGNSIIVFPEDSSKGYFDELTQYFCGFITFAKHCYNKGIDLPIYNMYLQRKTKKIIVDNPVKFSSIMHMDKEEAAQMFLNRANEMGRTDYSNLETK